VNSSSKSWALKLRWGLYPHRSRKAELHLTEGGVLKIDKGGKNLWNYFR